MTQAEVAEKPGKDQAIPVKLCARDADGNLYEVAVDKATGAVLFSASTLPLASGAATSAKQDTGNASLASIATAQTSGAQKSRAMAVAIVSPASFTLPGSPAGTLTSSYAAASAAIDVPDGASFALIHVSYTGGSGSTNGAASHKVLIGDGTYQGAGPDGTYSAIAGVSAAAAATSKYVIGPINVRGSSKINLSSAETGDTGHVGLIAATVSFG